MKELPALARWSCYLHFTILLSVWVRCCGVSGEPPSHSFEMKMIYKFSDEFREQMKAEPGMEHIIYWPRHSTADFHHELARHDQYRHASRNLLTADVFSLLPTNTTLYSRTMGGLHYSFIELGTPPQLFFVALDTGSDLLWVPCDCQQCAAADWPSYGVDIPDLEFAVYSPSKSTTSKAVACNDVICDSTLTPEVCDANAPQSCTYAVRYVSADTSSSGPVVQDVVYLTSETSGSNFTSEIYLGCGQLQTGDFLKKGAPNGLFGLGPEIYSVPSTFARNGITKNVFSMCFSSKDASGTLVFGRQPGASLPSTPIIPVVPSAFYVLGIEGFVAGGGTINLTNKVVFDTGTSYTVLPSNVVKPIGDALSATASLESYSFDIDIASFDYCWNITTKADLDSLSSLSIVFSGGKLWTISAPLVRFDDEGGNLLFVCLGILSSNITSTTTPIIGCSGTNGTSTLAPSISPEPALTVPAPAPGKSSTAPESSQLPPPPGLDTQAPSPPQISSISAASSFSCQFMPFVLLISSTIFLLLSK